MHLVFAHHSLNGPVPPGMSPAAANADITSARNSVNRKVRGKSGPVGASGSAARGLE